MVGCILALLAGTPARGDIISLIAYVSTSIYQEDEVTPLPMGSIVLIFGSTDPNNDGPVVLADGSFFPTSTQGDDVYLGMVRIGQPYWHDDDDNPVPGTFLSYLQISWDNEELPIEYLYIRFFNATDFTPGPVFWGTSLVFQFNVNFTVVTQDFIGGYVASLSNNIMAVPEPATAHLLLLFGGLVVGLGAGMKKRRESGRPVVRTPGEAARP